MKRFLIFVLLFAVTNIYAKEKMKPVKAKLTFSGGMSYPEISALNNHLQANGVGATLDSSLVSLGFDYQIISKNWISDMEFQWTLTQSKTAGSERLRYDTAIQLYNMGYLLLNYNYVHFYPLIGVGHGVQVLDIGSANTLSFDEILAGAQKPIKLERSSLVFNAALGLDVIIPTKAKAQKDKMNLVIGVRGGYLYDALKNEWTSGGSSAAGGPMGTLSGWYIRGLIGIAI